MEYVLDTLQTHIIIDMVNHRNDGLFESVGLLDDERKLLYEEHGVFNGCEELAKEMDEKRAAEEAAAKADSEEEKEADD